MDLRDEPYKIYTQIFSRRTYDYIENKYGSNSQDVIAKLFGIHKIRSVTRCNAVRQISSEFYFGSRLRKFYRQSGVFFFFFYHRPFRFRLSCDSIAYYAIILIPPWYLPKTAIGPQLRTIIYTRFEWYSIELNRSQQQFIKRYTTGIVSSDRSVLY